MRKVIRLPQLPWDGPKDLELSLTDSWQVETCNMAGYNRPEMTTEEIRESIRNPISAAPIRESARNKKEIVILFDDMHRVTRVSKIVPFVLEELAEAGIDDQKIRFIAAPGSHAPMNRIDLVKKLGEDILARFPVYNHSIYNKCTYVGTTSRGTEVHINSEVMMCDYKIAIGSVTPQTFVAFGGGGKMILPGVASEETILANHSMTCDEKLKRNYKTNPMKLDILEAAQLAGLDFNVECILNFWGETSAIYAGDLISAHTECIEDAMSHYLSPKAVEKDIIIANSFAKASEYATAALKAFECSNSKGGIDIVVIGNAPDGQVVHLIGGPWGRFVKVKRALRFKIPEHVKHLIIFSEYPDITGLGFFEESEKIIYLNKWDAVLQTLKRFHGENAEVAVYPNADIQYFGEE